MASGGIGKKEEGPFPNKPCSEARSEDMTHWDIDCELPFTDGFQTARSRTVAEGELSRLTSLWEDRFSNMWEAIRKLQHQQQQQTSSPPQQQNYHRQWLQRKTSSPPPLQYQYARQQEPQPLKEVNYKGGQQQMQDQKQDRLQLNSKMVVSPDHCMGFFTDGAAGEAQNNLSQGTVPWPQLHQTYNTNRPARVGNMSSTSDDDNQKVGTTTDNKTTPLVKLESNPGNRNIERMSNLDRGATDLRYQHSAMPNQSGSNHPGQHSEYQGKTNRSDGYQSSDSFENDSNTDPKTVADGHGDCKGSVHIVEEESQGAAGRSPKSDMPRFDAAELINILSSSMKSCVREELIQVEKRMTDSYDLLVKQVCKLGEQVTQTREQLTSTQEQARFDNLADKLDVRLLQQQAKFDNLADKLDARLQQGLAAMLEQPRLPARGAQSDSCAATSGALAKSQDMLRRVVPRFEQCLVSFQKQNTLVNETVLQQLSRQIQGLVDKVVTLADNTGRRLDDLEEKLSSSSEDLADRLARCESGLGGVARVIGRDLAELPALLGRAVEERLRREEDTAQVRADLERVKVSLETTLDTTKEGILEKLVASEYLVLHEMEQKLEQSSENLRAVTCDQLIECREKTESVAMLSQVGLVAKLEEKVDKSVEVVARRMYSLKRELFAMMDREGQLLRDAVLAPTPDGEDPARRRNFNFDFYVDNFAARAKAAVPGEAQGPEICHVISGVDTRLHSYPWYVPQPVNTSVQGYVNFTAKGGLDVYLLFARNPYELGLVPRLDMLMDCQVYVTDLSGKLSPVAVSSRQGEDDVSSTDGGSELGDRKAARLAGERRLRGGHRGVGRRNNDQGRSWMNWSESAVNTNGMCGVLVGHLPCKMLIQRGFDCCYDDGAILLRYNLCVP